MSKYLLKNDVSHRLSMDSLHVRSSSMFSIQLPAVNFLFLFLLTCHVWCQNFTWRYVRSSSMFSISAVVNFLFSLFLFFLVLVNLSQIRYELFLLTCHVWCQIDYRWVRYVRSSSMFSIAAVSMFSIAAVVTCCSCSFVTFGVRISN